LTIALSQVISAGQGCVFYAFPFLRQVVFKTFFSLIKDWITWCTGTCNCVSLSAVSVDAHYRQRNFLCKGFFVFFRSFFNSFS